MKSLVTGATGFLGSHIVDRLLEHGGQVRALVRASSDTSYLESRGVELARGDVTDRASLAAALDGVQTVYHAAAYVSDWGAWRRFQSVTVEGTRNMIEAAVEAQVRRLVHVSTDGVYALRALRQPLTEESPLEKRFGWLDYYRRSKLAAERVVRERGSQGRIETVLLRPGLLLGERDAAVLPGAIAFLQSGSAAYLGSGENRLPYVYVGDVAAACVLAGTSDIAAGQTYNVASGERVTQRDFFRAVAEVAGVPEPRRSVPWRLAYALALAMEAWCVLRGRRSRPELTRLGINLIALDYQEDASRLRRELGWEPTVGMREAIRRSVEWTRERPAERARG